MSFLDNEINSVLNKSEMQEIIEFRQKLAYKTIEQSQNLIYEWTKTGKITKRQHVLLCQYFYGRN